MKKLFVTAVFSCLLLGIAQAQTIPFTNQAPLDRTSYQGTHRIGGGWAMGDYVPQKNIGMSAYCGGQQLLIGATQYVFTGCSETISITATGGKDPQSWILFAEAVNWAPLLFYYTDQFYYWTSCDQNGTLFMGYNNPNATPNVYAPESC